MLPDGVGLRPNLKREEAEESAQQFGHLQSHHDALLPWVRTIAPDATDRRRVLLEWAPGEGTIAGSAFDAFVEYGLPSQGLGFLGIECKYAENLSKAQPKRAAEKFKTATTRDDWTPGAAEELDRPRSRQFWDNQLLVQIVLRADSSYVQGRGVVVACEADTAAENVVDVVRAQLLDPDSLRFASIESVVKSVSGLDTWRGAFEERYLDFSPISEFLKPDDPRRR